MRIVIDTNILIRMLISPDGFAANLFYPLKEQHELFISSVSFEEINKHRVRIKKISRLSEKDFETLLANIISDVSVISFQIISNSIIIQAMQYTTSVDIDDVPFVASAIFIGGYLWTSDKILFTGLKKRGYSNVFNNSDIKELIKR
jgi:predicted nucleic acid-binding protein